jgi:hypothetical protein
LRSSCTIVLGIGSTTLVSPLVGDSVLSTPFVALLVGFAIQALGRTGEAALRGIAVFQRVVFKVLAMIMWAAPIGAFGAIAAVVGETGADALKALALIMIAFYITRGHWAGTLDRGADLAVVVHDHRFQGRGRGHRRGPGHAGRRPAVPPVRIRRVRLSG